MGEPTRRRKPKKMDIRQDLIDQLDRKGVVGEHYIDLVFDYMHLWTIKNKLLADIRKRGVSVKYQNGPNQWGYRKNDSIAELNRTSAQMLKILQDLGLQGSKFEGVVDDYDDDEGL